MKSYRIAMNMIRSILTFKVLILVTIIFLAQYLIFINLHDNYKGVSIINLIILCYYGPQNIGIGAFVWLSHQAPLYLFIGLFLDKEINERIFYTLTRIRNIYVWFNGIIFSSFIFIVIYYFIGFVITYILLYIHIGTNVPVNNKNILGEIPLFGNYSYSTLLFCLFILLVASTLGMVLIYVLLTLAFNNQSIAFTIIIMVIFLSISLSASYSSMIKWLPPAQGMLIKHDLMNLTLTWSAFYSAFIILFFFILLRIILHRKIFDFVVKTK